VQLATLTLGRFQVCRGTAGHIPVYVALDPREAAELESQTKPDFDRAPDVATLVHELAQPALPGVALPAGQATTW
jgi:hypothetical protein